MSTPYDLDHIPISHSLSCGAKLVAMLIQNLQEENPFSCLLAIQGSIEVFAAQAATPLEKLLAQSMRAMTEGLMRRNPSHHHPHGKAVKDFIEATQSTRYGFKRKLKR